MPDHCCGSCRHWHDDDPPGSWRHCTQFVATLQRYGKLEKGTVLPRSEAPLRGYDVEYLHTREQFGCDQWLPLEELSDEELWGSVA